MQPASDTPEPVQLRPGAHLFLDDHLIARSEGLARITHQPEKLPEPVLRRAEPWHLQPQWFLHVTRDTPSGLFRTWYNVKNPGGRPFICYAYAESEDGVSWRRPDLGLVEVDGSTRNNLIDAPRGHFGLFFVNEGPGCPVPERRYKLGYYGEGLCVAFSTDGFHFTAYAGNPVIPAHPEGLKWGDPGYVNTIGDIIDGCWDPLRREYLMGCKIEVSGFPGKPHHHAEGWRRCVGVAASPDFLAWPRPSLTLTPDPASGMGRSAAANGRPLRRPLGRLQAPPMEEFYGLKPMVRGDLYIGFLRVLRDDLPADPGGPVEGIGWTELMSSRDGRRWTRYPEPFIDRDTRPGTWDHAMAWFADCVTVGDREYVYYGGYSAGHKVGHREVGLAFLRRNGFVSRDAGPRPGLLCTPVVRLEGGALAVNAAVRGEVRLRLTMPDGAPLPGFDWDDAPPLCGDAVAQAVRWRGATAGLPSCPLRLEFRVCRAALYGFEVVGAATAEGR
ncbi:MAG: hypothetical protein AB1505_32865 [Candidatus Latescibacterota bacterium]